MAGKATAVVSITERRGRDSADSEIAVESLDALRNKVAK